MGSSFTTYLHNNYNDARVIINVNKHRSRSGSHSSQPHRPTAAEHDVTDEYAAYKLADAEGPGVFGIFYSVKRPTKNANEAKLIAEHRTKVEGLADWQILKKSFDRMK